MAGRKPIVTAGIELAGLLAEMPARKSERKEFSGQIDMPEERRVGRRMKLEGPIWEKSNLTLEEAAAYTGIGTPKLRELTDDKNCPFVLWNGSKRLLKRKKMDEYLEREFSI